MKELKGWKNDNPFDLKLNQRIWERKFSKIVIYHSLENINKNKLQMSQVEGDCLAKL